jgi:hypothetical protein
MVFYKNQKRSRLTLKERLIKNKQYLKRRLLRISKRASWLKRKFSRRLKYIIKPRYIYSYYNETSCTKQGFYYSPTKVKKNKLKTYKNKLKLAQITTKLQTKVNKFNTVKVSKKILRNKPVTEFKYFN